MKLQSIRLHWLKTDPSPAHDLMPYGGQHASAHDIHWSEAPLWSYRLLNSWQRWRKSSAVRLPRLHGPMVHTLASLWRIWRADATLAMFESEGHVLAALRAWIPPLQRKPLVIVACWLAQDLLSITSKRRERLRRLYTQVTRVVVLSRNQRQILQDYLGLREDQVTVVHFGIDIGQANKLLDSVSDNGIWLSVGRDFGRDWQTLVEALALSDLPCNVLARPGALPAELPPNIHALPAMPESQYWQRLAACRGLVLAVHELAYPSGQTVLLQAMALGKPCVITATQALADYLPADSVLTVPAGKARALSEAVLKLDADPELRRQLGHAAKTFVRQHCSEARMWAEITRAVREVCS